MKQAAALLIGSLFLACGTDDPVAPPITPQPVDLAVLVRGTLFSSDMAVARGRHDPLASGGEVMAKAAGDVAHDVALGTGLFQSTQPHDFLGVDRWTSLEGMTSFYANPDFAAGFATLFDGMPTVEQFTRRSDYAGWGDLDAADGRDRWFVVVRGRFADEDAAVRKSKHDAAASGGEAAVRAAGDVAHVVYVGLQDDREFLAFDVWTSSAAIAGVHSNPDFQAAFQPIFSAPPSLQVYRGSDWHQW